MNPKDQKTCTYPDCNFPVNSPHDENLCLGHASIENKKSSLDQIDTFFRQILRSGDYHFDGFIFSTTEFINSHEFSSLPREVKFTNCKFYGEKLIGNEKYSLNISTITFRDNLIFDNCEFIHSIIFNNCNFQKYLSFNQSTKINGKLVLNGGSIKQLEIQNSFFSDSIEIKNNIDLKEFKIFFSELGGINFENKNEIIQSIIANENTFKKRIVIRNKIIKQKVNFSKCTFNEEFNLNYSNIEGDFIINNSTFNGIADFESTTFEKAVQFASTTFVDNSIFSEAKFNQESIWIETIFNKVYFNGSIFKGEADFSSASFCGYTEFVKTDFRERVSFSNASFLIKRKKIINSSGIVVVFQNTVFNYVVFKGIKIAGCILFDKLYLIDKSTFYLQEVEFVNCGRIIFKNTSFPSFSGFFESIFKPKTNRFLPSVLAFRNCNLNDIYFTNNDMSLLSFYKSAYENAIFNSNRWDNVKESIFSFKHNRRSLIFEDQLLNQINNLNTSRKKIILELYSLEDINSFEEIATLYRRFKVALDNTKDYEQAGWFYFNEYEMKRRAFKEQSRPKYIVYSLYKLFAGYGEKPLWSFYWFLILLMGFTFANLFSGIKLATGSIINYDFSFSLNGLTNLFTSSFWLDVYYSFLFTLFRIIPISYLPVSKEQFLPIGGDGYFLAFLNTAILILFITFIAIGLKRIFRRF